MAQKDNAALSAFFLPKANTKGKGRSVLHGCQVSAEDHASDLAPPRPRIPDGRHPPAGIPLYAPHGNHLHICRSNVCAFREGRPNSIIELWYAVSGQGGGWTDENRSCSREKRNKKKPGRCPGNEGALWENYEKCYGWGNFLENILEYWVFFFQSWSGFGFVWTCEGFV